MGADLVCPPTARPRGLLKPWPFAFADDRRGRVDRTLGGWSSGGTFRCSALLKGSDQLGCGLRKTGKKSGKETVMACRGAFQSETRRHLRLERLENRHLLSVAESLASASDRQPGLGSPAAGGDEGRRGEYGPLLGHAQSCRPGGHQRGNPGHIHHLPTRRSAHGESIHCRHGKHHRSIWRADDGHIRLQPRQAG